MSCSCEGDERAPSPHLALPLRHAQPQAQAQIRNLPLTTPRQVTTPLHEESPTVLVREIVVKPVPFVTVAVRQEFELREADGGLRLCRAEYTKQ